MLFNSYIFILLFLPISLAGWYLLNKKGLFPQAMLFLIGMSLWFYAYFNISYLFIIVFSILINYLLYKGMGSLNNRKALLFLGIVINLGLLFYFKYYDFFLENLNILFQKDFTLKNILLPLGISFFTFQQLGFIIDAYKGEAKDYSFIEYALFVTFFPQLIAGPIVTHNEMIPQFKNIGGIIRKKGNSYIKGSYVKDSYIEDSFAKGIYAFSCGLSKKVLMADVLGKAVDTAYAMNGAERGFLLSLLIVFAYSLQLYFDFSGYCDMARGIGWMFGIEITVNFDSPYKSLGSNDFWTRWHITLGRFLRNYIFIPLGGSKNGSLKKYLNYFIVFLVSGIWHGASWNFIIWGLLHGIWRVLHSVYEDISGKIRGIPRPDDPQKGILNTLKRAVGILITFTLVSLLWVIFRSPTLDEAFSIYREVFTFIPGMAFTIPTSIAECFRSPEFFYILKVVTPFSPEKIDLFLTGFYMLTGLSIVFFAPSLNAQIKDFRPDLKKSLFSAFLFLWSLVSLSGVSSFLYFNF